MLLGILKDIYIVIANDNHIAKVLSSSAISTYIYSLWVNIAIESTVYMYSPIYCCYYGESAVAKESLQAAVARFGCL